jgi:phosphonopyruvate decarboxylase
MTRTITREDQIADGARLLRAGNGTAFVLLRVKPTDPPGFKRNMDAAAVRIRFKTALQRDGARA